jgi:Rrf2 family protein
MQLSKRCEYALRTLINLGVAQRAGREIVPVQELASREHLPPKFLEQILRQLREAGLVTAKRGKAGGYRWSSTASRTTVAEIVRLVDGPLAPIRCVSATEYEPCSCPDEERCGLRLLMLEVRNAVAAILERTHLDDVVEVASEQAHGTSARDPFAAILSSRPPSSRLPRRRREKKVP